MGESVSLSVFLKDFVKQGLLSLGKTSDKVFDDIDEDLDDLDRRSKRTAQSVTGIGGAFRGLGRLVGTLGLSLGLSAAVIGAGKLGIEAEQTNVAFTTMTGSAQIAQNTIKDLSDFASKTPYGKREVLDAGKQMLAYGFTAEELKTKLTNIGDVASGLGQPLGEMAYLFGTIKTQGKAMTQDLNQFAGRGVPIFEEVAKVMGISKDQVKDYAAESKISYAVIEQAFANMSGEGGKFFHMMDAQSQTAGGRISTMMDNLAALGEKLGVAMLPLINSFIDLGSVLLENLMPAINAIAPIFSFIGENLNTILLVLAPLAAAWAAYQAVTLASAAATAVMTAVQWSLNAALTANPVGLVVAAIAAFVAAIVIAWKNSETFRGIVLGLWEVLKGFWGVVVQVAKAVWDFAPPFVMLRETIAAFGEVVQWLWPIVQDVFGKIGSWIKDTFGAAIGWVTDKIKALFGWLLTVADKMGLGKVVDKIRGAFNTGFDKGKDGEPVKSEEDAVKALGASTTLNQIGAQAKKTKDTTKEGLTGVSGDAKAARTLTVNINKLVETFNVNTTNIKEGSADVRRILMETLAEAVRDVETSYA